MTNLKKTLAVVLAFAMILSMGAISTFAAYSDVEAGTKVYEAVGILSNLNILTGFEDGTFKPDETVTRAQMAAIICRTLGYEDQAQSSMGSTVFNDVAADHWASGYINVAQAQQIINGYGDGNYGPEDKVTYEQAVKMIVSALGYELAAQAKGGYPTGYLAIASAEGITKNANGRVGDAAARGTIAVLVYNSLEVRLMDQTSWSTGSDGDKYGKTTDTILSKYLEVRKWEGIVTDTPLSGIAGGTYDPDATPKMNINGSYKYYNDKGEDATYYGRTGAVDCSLVDANAFLGKAVIAYIGFEDDPATGNKMVYAIVEDNDNEIIEISGTQLIESTDDAIKFSTPGVIYYREVGATRMIDVELDRTNVDVYVNSEYKGAYSSATSTSDLATLVGSVGGKIELVSNDNDSSIDTILVTSYDDESVIETVEVEDGLYMFELYNGGNLSDIDAEDEDELVIVYKDGVLADVAALAANDTVSSVEIAKGLDVLYVSSATVTGAVESYSADDMDIAGETYELSKAALGSGKTYAGLADEEGIFFLNVDGQVAWNETDTVAAGNYGLVVAVDENTNISGGYVAQVVLADGTVAEYTLNTSAKIKGVTDLASGDAGYDARWNTGDADKDVYTFFSSDNRLTRRGSTSTYEATAQNIANNIDDLVWKVTVKNDKISRFSPLNGTATSLTSNTKEYDEYSMSIGDVSMDEGTVVFAIDDAATATTPVDVDKIKVGVPSDFFADGEDGYVIAGLDLNTKSVSKAVVGFDLAVSVAQDSAAIIVSDYSKRSYNDETAMQITGLQAGKEVTYIIYNDDDAYDWSQDPMNIGIGDVILVSAPDAEGVCEDFQLLYDRSADTLAHTNATNGDPADDIYNAAADLTKFENNLMYLNAPVQNYTGSTPNVKYNTGDGIPTRDTANYTLVDYTENAKNPDVVRKSAGTSLFSKGKNNTEFNVEVFVRIYDDKLVEVVVYKTNAAGAQLAAPVATPGAGEVANGATVALSAAAGSTIRYTTDGTEPTESTGTVYSAPISITGNTTIKAIAVKSGNTTSNVATFVYTVAASE